jgi:hypothetical protein
MTQTNETRHAGARLGSERMRFLAGTAAPSQHQNQKLRKQLFATCFGLPINLAISPAPRWVIEPLK